MFEQAGCEWCEVLTARSRRSMENRRRLACAATPCGYCKQLPPDLAFVEVERLTPLFVLDRRGREIGAFAVIRRGSFLGPARCLAQKLDAADKATNARSKNNIARVELKPSFDSANWIARRWNCNVWNLAAGHTNLIAWSITPNARAISQGAGPMKAG